MTKLENFSENLAEKVAAKNSCLLLGLDPDVEKMPSKFAKNPAGIFDFLIEKIEQTEKYIVGVKPNLAYFEVWGSGGIAVLEKILAVCRRKNLFILSDVKRGDIGTTAEKYASAFLAPSAPLESDAITINPFCGEDGIEPFVRAGKKQAKGVFVWVAPSNPSAGKLLFRDAEISVKIAKMVEDFGISSISEKNFFSGVGAVVGATLEPKFLDFWRAEMPTSWLLCPGVGAQGGDLQAVLNLRKNNLGVLVPLSRSILFAENPETEIQKFYALQK